MLVSTNAYNKRKQNSALFCTTKYTIVRHHAIKVVTLYKQNRIKHIFMRRKYPNIILSSELLQKEIIKITNHTHKNRGRPHCNVGKNEGKKIYFSQQAFPVLK